MYIYFFDEKDKNLRFSRKLLFFKKKKYTDLYHVTDVKIFIQKNYNKKENFKKSY